MLKANLNDASTLSVHRLDVRDLRAEAFASYGEVVASLRADGEGAKAHHNPETPPTEANRVPSNGAPRVCIMHVRHVGLRFSRIARRRRVTQCLGSRGGREWPIGVALPSDLSDDARPRPGDIVAFRIPGDRVVKGHVATWHTRTHFVHDEWQFVNLENLHTNRRDFDAAPFPAECRYRL